MIRPGRCSTRLRESSPSKLSTAGDDSHLLPGDIVVRVGEDDIADADAAYLALAEAEESTKVLVRRNGKRKTLTIEPIEGVKVRKLLEFRD